MSELIFFMLGGLLGVAITIVYSLYWLAKNAPDEEISISGDVMELTKYAKATTKTMH